MAEKSRLSLSGWFHSTDQMKPIPEVPLPFPNTVTYLRVCIFGISVLSS